MMAQNVATAGAYRKETPAQAEASDPTADIISRAEFEATQLGTKIHGAALVLRCDPATDRSGQPYLQLTLRGSDGGRIEARWWRYPYPIEHRPAIGQICTFVGKVESYAGERQLTINSGARAPQIDVCIFARSTRRTVGELQNELAERIASLDPACAALVRGVLTTEIYERFCTWPAALQMHGAVRHGLLAHSLRVVALAEGLAHAYRSSRLMYDTHLVTTACLLHDVGKTQTLPRIAGGAPPELALLLDHVTCSVNMVRDAARLCEPALDEERLGRLVHAILAHHGRREWGAPVEPQTTEAWLVHLADLAESRLWGHADEELP